MRVFVGIALIVAAPAAAQTCPSPAGWAKPERHLAARSPTMRFALKPGGTAQISLLAAKDVTLAADARKPRPNTSAGLAAIDVGKPGKLDVILSNATYVDLVRDGKALRSSGHSDFKKCPGFRKSVSFDVVPGRYIVQMTDAPTRSVKMATVLR